MGTILRSGSSCSVMERSWTSCLCAKLFFYLTSPDRLVHFAASRKFTDRPLSFISSSTFVSTLFVLLTLHEKAHSFVILKNSFAIPVVCSELLFQQSLAKCRVRGITLSTQNCAQAGNG